MQGVRCDGAAGLSRARRRPRAREDACTLYVGDEITLVSPLGDLGPMGVMPRTRKFRVAAIFYSGMYEYDATHVYMMLDVAQDSSRWARASAPSR